MAKVVLGVEISEVGEMLIQSHSLLAKLLNNILCQKTVSLGTTTSPYHVGSELEGEATWRGLPKPPVSPLLSEGRASAGKPLL